MVESALKMQCYIVENTLLHTVFYEILLVGLYLRFTFENYIQVWKTSSLRVMGHNLSITVLIDFDMAAYISVIYVLVLF